ncbi:MAG: DUF3667 domain-containing protein, partial [Bacteroidetes bacterium]|nr:DUF3667 domain-containing protein [Bacteroidota bacterium]
FKSNSEKISFENVSCKNCKTHFNGKYCPECGQSVKDYDQPFTFIFYNFAGDFFSFDTRFFRTFAALLIKPGFLTKEYFDGRRVKYAPPFRIFIFASFILFLLLQTYTNKGLTTVLDSSLKERIVVGIDSVSLAAADSIFNNVRVEIDSTSIPFADSLLNNLDLIIDSTGESLNFKFNMETFRDTRDLRQGLNTFANVLEKKLGAESDPNIQARLRENISMCRSPEQAVAKILEYLSWAFFLLLPIFAIILKLVYFRRKQNYMRHLIFSIHIHSFIFIVLTFIVGLNLIFNGNLGTVVAIILLCIPVYFIVALKKFYGQSIKKVILKFFAVSFLYNIIFWFIVAFVFLNALSII